jgi:nicotinamide riboside kinase
MQAGFFADLTLCGLLSRLTFFNVSFWNCPTVFRVLNQKDFDFALLVTTKNDTASGWLADNFRIDGL